MDNKMTKILGIVLVFIGIGYLGDQFDFWNFTIFFRGWWCVLMTLFAFYTMMQSGINVFNSFFAILGVYFFMLENDVIEFEASIIMIFSVFLIIAGLKLMLTKDKPIETYEFNNDYAFKETKTEENVQDVNTEESTNQTKKIFVSTFVSTKQVSENGIVDRCRIENMMGTVYLDLSEADLRTLDALSIDTTFGRVEILVGNDVNLKMYKGKVISGSFIDSTYTENGYDVLVRGTNIFGTIHITKKKPE